MASQSTRAGDGQWWLLSLLVGSSQQLVACVARQ